MSSILPPNQWTNLDPLTYITGAIKDIAEKLTRNSETLSDLKTDMAIIKATFVTKEECSKKTENCTLQREQAMSKIIQLEKGIDSTNVMTNQKSFLLKELSGWQIIAVFIGTAVVLGILMGDSGVFKVLGSWLKLYS